MTNEREMRMKQLLKVTNHLYNEIIGGNENAMMDGEEYYAYTMDELVEEITNTITNNESYIRIGMEMIEAKHFRFMGKDEIKAIVFGRCIARHNEDGKWMWEA